MTPEHWQKLKGILDGALSLPADQLEGFLAQSCSGDSALRGEVEALIVAHQQAGDFIETHVVDDALRAMTSHHAKLTSQTRIGNYQIIKEIGHGGMGTVYLAERADEYRKQVAIKVIREGPTDNRLLHRFLSERQILANLDHPNIARLIDGGSTDSGFPYLVMEYVEGDPIDDYCENHAFSLEKRLDLFQQVCSAVAYAHRNLIVHRDLKPGNILVTKDGSAKLLDFGIAKLLEEGTRQDEQTATVARVMTPQYASPEQARGEMITTASDIYSLGVLLYKLLTGKGPYQFPVLTHREIERVICEEEPERPSRVAHSNEEVGPSRTLRGDLDNIVLMALRKDPQRRYVSVEQFAEDIRRHQQGLPVRARNDTFSYRCSKFISRNRYGVAAAALIILSLLVGAVATFRQYRVAQRERAKAVAVNTFLQTMLNASSPEVNARNLEQDLTVKEVLDEAARRLATEDLSGVPEVKAELQRIIGASYLARGQYKLAEENLTAALAAQSQITGEKSVEALKILVQLGSLWMSTGDYERADRFYQESLPLLRQHQRDGSMEAAYLASSLANMALRRRAVGDSKQAASLLRESLALPYHAASETRYNRDVAETILALTLADQGEFDEAIRIVRAKVLALRQRQDSAVELGASLTGLGSFLLDKGEFVEAQASLSEGESLYRKVYSQSTIQVGDNLRLQAQTALARGDLSGAESKINQTWEIYRTTKPQYINYATALTIQGMLYHRTSRSAEAEKLLREAFKLRQENMPETHFLRALTAGALGEFLVSQKNYQEAEKLLLASYTSLKNSQSTNSPRIRLAISRLVDLYTSWGRLAEADTYKRQL